MRSAILGSGRGRALLVGVAVHAVVTVHAFMTPARLSAQESPGELRDRVEAAQDGPGELGLGEFSIPELLEELGVPAVSIAVIHDFDIHWTRAFGLADTSPVRRVDIETVFQAASISKPVTAMAVLAAARDGNFGLDDDINSILTSWQLDGEGFTVDRPVTLRTLLSHTSGLGDAFGFPGYEPGADLPTAVQVLDGAPPSTLGPVFMERAPLTFYEYSGGGTTVVQQALTDALGLPFAEIMRRSVLDPLGMVRSTYSQPLPESWEANAARAHDEDGARMGPPWHVYPEQAAAGLWTTPTDLARFVVEVQKSLRGESNLVLDTATVREMVTPVGVGPYAVGLSVAQRGEGWYFSHGGSNWGFRARILGHFVKGYGVVVMTNADGGGRLIDEIVRRVEEVYGWDSVAEPVARGYRRAGG